MLTPKLSYTGLMTTLPKVAKTAQAQEMRVALAKNASGKGLINALQQQQAIFLKSQKNAKLAGWANDPNIKGVSFFVQKGTGLRIVGLDGLPVKQPVSITYKPVAFSIGAFASTLATPDFENLFSHMYLDSQGHVTIGVGHLIADEATAVGLHPNPILFQWQVGKGSGLVTPADIRADYRNVKTFAGTLAEDFEPATRLEMSQSNALALAKSDIAVRVNEVRANSGYKDFGTFPIDAQKAIADMVFTLGSPVFLGYINFKNAVRHRDWKTAAAESSRGGVHQPRNDTIIKWLENAATAEPYFISTDPKNASKRLNVMIKPDGSLILKEGKATP
ncbi:MAG: hypothetical protein IID51_03625 [Proteobacteria bacterium]|nr:hypothetical protein [Pseudomonadota bacterium]